MTKTPTRLPSETAVAVIGAGMDLAGHPVNISLVRHPETGAIVEVVMVSDGKIGSGVDLLVQQLGIAISRMIQGRDPDTGEERDR